MKKFLVVALVAAGVAFQVNAHLVNPNGTLVVGYNDTQQSMDGLVAAATTNQVTDVSELWKWEDTNSGELSGNGISVVFNPVNANGIITATLSWNLTGTGAEMWAVAWKDGTLNDSYSSNVGFYWSLVTDNQRFQNDGDTISLTIDLDPAFKNPNAWSHIAFYGRPGTSVPDGGATLALIGVAITGLGLLRRKLS